MLCLNKQATCNKLENHQQDKFRYQKKNKPHPKLGLISGAVLFHQLKVNKTILSGTHTLFCFAKCTNQVRKL